MSTFPGYPTAARELRGDPKNTILAVPGLAQAGEDAHRALLDAAEVLRIPVDSLAVVIAGESSWKPHALNYVPAAGLIQLTTGANLPGFGTAAEVRAVATWPADRQIREIVVPHLRRFGFRETPDPGRLYLANFYPAALGKPEGHVIAERGRPVILEPDEVIPRRSYSAAVYAANEGLDRDRKGTITVGDVYRYAASIAASSGGRRLLVDAAPPDAPPGAEVEADWVPLAIVAGVACGVGVGAALLRAPRRVRL